MKDLVEDRSANSQDEIMAEIADGITLMEPRILLDAVLNLDPGLTDGDALIASAAALKAHDSEFDRVLEGIESSFAQSIGGVAGAYDSDSNTRFGDAGAGEVVADKVFKAVREAVDASLVAFETNLQDFAQAQGQSLLDAVNASLHSLIGFVPSTIDTVADLQSYLTVDLVSDIDALNTAASVLGGDTAAFNGQLILNGVMNYATANNLTADLFEIDLQDAQVATGSFIGIPTGFVDVSYTQDGSDVRVSVGAPNLTLDIDEGTAGSPFDELDNVSTPVRDFAFDFDLGATVTADELRIGSSDFALAEFKIGDPDTKTQFVGATEVITNIAQLGFQAQGFGDLNIAGVYDKNIEASGGLTGEAALSFATTITGPFDDTFSPVDVGGSGVIIHHDVRLFGATITTAPVSTVVQPTAPVAFQAGTPAGGGTGFGGAGSGDANQNIADAGLIFGGLAAILEEADNAIDAVLEATALPIIGDNLGLGFTLFDDLRFDLIPQTSAQSGSANSDGSPKTTADLLENELNTGLNAVLGTSNVRYVEAEIVGFADTSQNFLHGNIGFKTKIFDAQIASPFDFGVDLPGLDFDFENGSPLTLTTFADLNIGFGVDGSGFFLLNDTDQSEISLTFEVDAGDFEGQFSVGGLLDFSAVAVKDPTQLATFDFAEAPAPGEKGDVKLTATLGADLFADFGTATAKDLTGITATKGNGTVVTWEHEVRFDEINRATALGQSIVETDLSANGDINLQLTGNVLDPTTGKPVSITVDTDDGPRDVNVLPTLMTELVIDASLTPGGAGIQLDQVLLNDLRLDAADLYLGVIEPFIDPLQPFVEPIQGLYDVINTQPFSTVLPLAATAVPAIGLASDIVTIANKFADIVQGLNETDGFVLAGDVFFENGVPTFKADINASNGDPDNAPQSFEDYLAEAGVTKPTTNSLSIDIPILTDVSNMLALIQGNFDQVELVTAEFVGLDFDINSKSITSFITDEIDDLGIDSRVIEAIIGEFSASASIEAFFGFQAGYDLSGLQGFVDSQDIGALLSGVFIDTDAPNGDGGILDFSASASLNFSKGLDIGVASGEAGLKASGGGAASVSLDDPNGDGKLRLNEITKLLAEIDPTDFDEYMTAFFDGSLDFDFSFRIFGNIKAVGVTVFDESITFIKIEEDLSFNGGGGVNLVLSDDLPGDTTVLNVGSKAADSFAVRNVTEFSNTVEQINLTGDVNQVLATWIRLHDGSPDFVVSTPALIDTLEANAVIVPAGEGINIVDSSGLSNVDTLTYLGDGLPFNNNIDLSTTGFHVVFGGDTGNDVRALGNVADDATYWIFGGRGDDNVVIEGGNSLFFAEDFYGIRDAFESAFKNGGFSQAAAEAVFASHMQSQGIGDGTFAGALAALKDHHTINTQLTAATATNLWTAGRDGHDVGTHMGFGGAGHDSFIVRGADTATALTGAGDDNIQLTTANGGFGEGGAGSDFVTANVGDDEVYGFAKAAEASSFLDSGANRALLYQDGNDHIFLGSGDDSAFGQFGDDVIEGSAGDDRVDGGQGNDIVAGGKIIAKKADGSILSISDLTVQGAEGTTISALTDVSQLVPLAASLVFNDGKDSVGGGDGDDIVLGGFDADTLTATSGNNVIIGDNAAIEFVSAGVIKSVISQDVGSDQNGGDSIFGGSGFDLIVGGGSAIANASGFNSEWVQDTASANILIGDDAEIYSDTNVLGEVTLIRSVAGAGDDARDNLFSGAGSILIGGEGSDQMRSRLGGSILIGDLGTVDFVAGKVTSTDTDTFGHDSIAFSVAGNAGTVGAVNFIIGGGGSDLVGGSAFTDYAIADSGEITFDAAVWEEMKSHTFIQDRAAASAAELAEEDAALARFEGLVSKMTSAGLESDGDDNFRLREGGDRLIAGGGNDGPTQSTTGVILEVNGRGFGDGIFVLDSGTIDLANGTAEVVSNEYAGNDAISTGAGNHIILAGGGDDLVELGRHDFTSRAMTAEEFAVRNGNGNHAILGDSGTITWDADTGAIKVLNSLSRSTDGNDTVGRFQDYGFEDSLSNQNGNNNVVLGGGDDTITLGNANSFSLGTGNRIVADGGKIDLADGLISSAADISAGLQLLIDIGLLTLTDPVSYAGDDLIDLGTGTARIVGGGGSDKILLDDLAEDAGFIEAQAVTSGNHIVLADSGLIDWDPNFGIFTKMESTDLDFAGDDLVLAGDGNHRIILGGNLDLENSTGVVTQGLDTAILGDGGNFVIGDAGKIDFIAGQLSSENNSRTGVDFITAGAGNNIVIGGSEFDTINLGLVVDPQTGELSTLRAENSSIVLGDNGTITYDKTDNSLIRMTGVSSADDRSDNIKVGSGANFAILGGGSDFFENGGIIGAAQDMVIGSAGTIDLYRTNAPGFGTMSSSSTGEQDNDRIRVGIGPDFVIGGDDNDSIVANSGVNQPGGAILGDQGSISFESATRTLTFMGGNASGGDGNDIIETGFGLTQVIMGGGNDRFTSRSGYDKIILGDGGQISFTANTVTAGTSDKDGDDVFNVLAGENLLIGGGGADGFLTGEDLDIVLGDGGTATFSFDADTDQRTIETVESETTENDGNDDVVERLDGDIAAILGGGDDSLLGVNGNHIVVGDGGKIDLSINQITASGVGTGGVDTIDAGTGEHAIAGGLGADTITVGNAANLVLGDTGVIKKANDDVRGGNVEGDGNDTISVGDGDNILVLGGGDDSLTAGNGNNLVTGDGGDIDRQTGNGNGTATTQGLDVSVTGQTNDDKMEFGTGANVVIAGSGADSITAGIVPVSANAVTTFGANALIGGEGTVTFDSNTRAVSAMTGFNGARDGSDRLTVAAGDDLIIGGGDLDRIYGGTGDNVLIGDDGATLLEATGNEASGSADATDGNDIITAADGKNIIIGGGAADRITLGNGADAILGDAGTIKFDDQRTATTLIATGDADGGNDSVTAGNGGNKALLGDGADTGSFGTGNDIVLGDSGSIVATGTATGTTDTHGGGDRITDMGGVNVVIAGAGGDSITALTGVDAVLGDNGTIAYNSLTAVPTDMTAMSDAQDGADTIAIGSGDNRVIAGGLNDTVTALDGNNTLLADSGAIDVSTGAISSTTDVRGGADSVTAGNGSNFVIGGSAGDRIDLGDGNNNVLADIGSFTTDAQTGALTVMNGAADSRDGADSITAGNGANNVLLGGANDTATFGTGANIIVGDGGSLNLSTGTVQSDSAAESGADSIVAGSGTNLILGGSLADRIDVAGGSDAILGDTGTITFNATRAALVLTSATDARDGADSVTGTSGSNAVVLGGDSDTATFGSGDNIIVADGGQINLTTGLAQADSSAEAGADSLTAGSGDNIILGGALADRIDVSGGSDAILGDTGSITFNTASGAALILTSVHDARDGGDSITADNGDNNVVLGGESDTATFGTGKNFAVADGGLINLTTGLAQVDSDDLAGADSLTAGSGDNLILAGAYADRIDVSGGDDVILADTGSITFDTGSRAAKVMTAAHDARDGTDSVTADNGNNAVILGGANDTAIFGTGNNVVVADGGAIDLTTGLARVDTDDLAGADSLTAGSGNNLILAGALADRVDVSGGRDAVLGDTGSITFDTANRTALKLVAAHDARDGADSITAADGDNWVILGGNGDTANFGHGANVILGDGGEINVATGIALVSSSSLSGIDSITAGDGNNRIIAGAFADRVDLGNGDNALLSDGGQITFNPLATGGRAGITMQSQHDTRDGQDSVTAGNGDNWAVLGGESDRGAFGGGDNIVLGDSGRINEGAGATPRSVATTNPGTGANDTLTFTAGNDVVLGDGGSDSILATAGNNFIAGDGGSLTFTNGVSDNLLIQFSALSESFGAADVIATGTGHDTVIGAVGDDSITTGLGDDIAAGDWINVIAPSATAGSLASTAFGVEGEDSINTGSGSDIAIGGGMDDAIQVGEGDDSAFGDNVLVLYTPNTNIEAVTLLQNGIGGNDSISATGAGDNLLVGQFGNDTLTGGITQDILIGDHATFGFLPTGVFGLGETQVDRLVEIDAIAPALGGDDLLFGLASRDILLAGFGVDSVFGGSDQDILAGDDFSINITFSSSSANGLILETLEFESNAPFLQGGNDLLDGEGGPDILIGGLGPDRLNGNTETDFLAGDAVAFLLTAPFADLSSLPPGAPGGLFAPEREFDLITVNFPGPGAGDVLSSAQVAGSLGFSLNSAGEANDEATGVAAIQKLIASGTSGVDLVAELSARANDLFTLISDTVSSSETVQRIADLLALDVPQDVLVEMIQNGLAQELATALGGDISALDRFILIKLIEQIVEPALEAAEEAAEEAEQQASVGGDTMVAA